MKYNSKKIALAMTLILAMGTMGSYATSLDGNYRESGKIVFEKEVDESGGSDSSGKSGDDSKDDSGGKSGDDSKDDSNGKLSDDKYMEFEKEIELEIEGMDDSMKSKIKLKFKEDMPYTALDDSDSVISILRGLTDGKLTDNQLKTIANNPKVLEKLGIIDDDFYRKITLKPIMNASFTDVSDDYWARLTIKKAAELGLAVGYEGGNFEPMRALKAEDTMVFLDRVMALNRISYMNMQRTEFENRLKANGRDDDRDKWYYYNVASLGSKLSSTTLDTLLSLGEKPVTRGLLAQMLYEITEGKLPSSLELAAYKDIADSPYKMALEYCVKTKLMNGTSDTQMSPLKPVTRAELMTILVRLDDSFDDSVFDYVRQGSSGSKNSSTTDSVSSPTMK